MTEDQMNTIDTQSGGTETSPSETGHVGKYIDQIRLLACPWVHKLPIIW